jgi:hypothetical protein
MSGRFSVTAIGGFSPAYTQPVYGAPGMFRRVSGRRVNSSPQLSTKLMSNGDSAIFPQAGAAIAGVFRRSPPLPT